MTLGWYEDSSGIAVSAQGRAALDVYAYTVEVLPGANKPKTAAIRGRTFAPEAVATNLLALEDAVRTVAAALLAS